MKNRLTLSITLAAALTLSLLFISNIYAYINASGPRLDEDEDFAHIEGAGECWVDGWDDGAVGKYNSERARECYDKGNQYNVAFGHAIDVCNDPNSASANKEDCEYSRNLEEDDNDD
jgi:hypothetical protein